MLRPSLTKRLVNHAQPDDVAGLDVDVLNLFEA